ncbi:MAG: GNAT family N-acetyltransferase [Acetobacteraceae bacterium]|nr:GNAT family N-acetyltransferase [Acetobacteraceae bacterium]
MRGAALIRPGRDEDAAGFIALIETCWADYPGCVLDVDLEAPELRALASYYRGRGGMLWIAGDADGMVATAPLGGGAWEICRVYVRPRLHGTGLGRELLAVAERHAIAAGAGELVLWTDTRFGRAHRFYESASYVREGPVRALHDIAGTIEYRYAKPVHGVRQLDVAGAQSAARSLAKLLVTCVDAGASVSFLAPLAPERALAFWEGVARQVGTGEALLFGGWAEGVLAGTVQLVPHVSEPGGHRAEIADLLVHPAFRRRGLGNALLAAAESAANATGRTLLLLHTKPGGDADRLCRGRSWTEAGHIERYTREADGRECATLIFCKQL